MPNFTVVWEIQISADTPRKAAEVARSFQRNPSSMVGVFDVIAESGLVERVDLDEDEGQACPDCGEDSGTRCGAPNCPY